MDMEHEVVVIGDREFTVVYGDVDMNPAERIGFGAAARTTAGLVASHGGSMTYAQIPNTGFSAIEQALYPVAKVLNQSKGKRVIFMTLGTRELLTEKERAWLLAHEAGHHHADNGGINPDEVAADKYADSIVAIGWAERVSVLTFAYATASRAQRGLGPKRPGAIKSALGALMMAAMSSAARRRLFRWR